MPQPKRVLCYTDMSCVGRASLTAALPVLGACGVQACPLPSMLLSTHTGGFGVPPHQDNANFGKETLLHYLQEGVSFDAVYIGYLGSDEQFELAEQILQSYPKAYVLVDPAMGDDGKLYASLPQSTVKNMLSLCQKADLITPNLTESALLLGKDPHVLLHSDDEWQERLLALSAKRSSVLVTGVRENETLKSLGYVPNSGFFETCSKRVPQSYPGTGDLLSASVLGLSLRGLSLQHATKKASAFLSAGIKATFDGGGEVRQGIWFEPHLSLLTASL